LVQLTREPHSEAARAARERVPVVRFHEEVHVIGLYGEVHDTKIAPRSPGDRRPQPPKWPLRTQVRGPTLRAKRQVHGMPMVVHGPRPMGRRPAPRLRLAAGAVTTAAPRFVAKLELRAHLN